MYINPSAQIISADPTIHDPRRRRTILIGVCIALIAVIASVSGLNVAQPQLALAIGASQSQVLWMINIYTITLAALLLPLGAAGDRWGRKHFLIVGLIVFGVASAAAGLAPNTEGMLSARFLSGIGAAMIMPVTLAIITSTLPVEERSKAIAVWTAVAGAGGILGMLMSCSRNCQPRASLLESTVKIRKGVIRTRLAAGHVGGSHCDDDRAWLRSCSRSRARKPILPSMRRYFRPVLDRWSVDQLGSLSPNRRDLSLQAIRTHRLKSPAESVEQFPEVRN
jgi:Na+/melibiose symporter-like transporter